MLSAAPATTLGLVTWLGYAGDPGGMLAGSLAALGGASAVSALAFALDAARMRRAFTHLRMGGGAFAWSAPQQDEHRAQRHHEIVRRMRRQIDQLSAIRDLALIANDDVEFARVLERALVVLSGLLSTREITIYLVEGPEEELVPVAHLLGERTTIRQTGGKPLKVIPMEAARAVEARRTILEPGRGGLRAATLLVADGTVMGAIEVRLPRAGDGRDPREIGRELEGLAKHIALAIRKPALYDRAVVDGLTGLYTKRHFLEQVQQHMAATVRLGNPLSLIILDVDHFKQVNDVHGHVAGDLVLAEVAQRVKGEVRGYDQAFRYGGEEVIVLAPNTPLKDAVALAERLREKLRKTKVDAGETQIPITASFGVAEFDPAAMHEPSDFVEVADGHLYRAKHGGRDQVQSALSAEEPAAAKAA
jgi:diguanylate cyclase (GGDEF)-like protein